MNGRVWTNTQTPIETVVVSNCLRNSEFVSDTEAIRMIRRVLRSANIGYVGGSRSTGQSGHKKKQTIQNGDDEEMEQSRFNRDASDEEMDF